MSAKQHWETIYRTKATTEVSWFQREAHVSLDLIRSVAPDLDSAILDVGGGASTLVDGLIERGYRSVTVLDIAPAALAAARERLGPAADGVRWIVADALTHPLPPGSVDVWHDRALFHFLTSADDRRTYVAQVQRAVRPNGHVIVATFAAEGPTRCSGLEVRRYGPTELHREFGQPFELLHHILEEHITPSGAHQAFEYCLCAYRVSQAAELDAASIQTC